MPSEYSTVVRPPRRTSRPAEGNTCVHYDTLCCAAETGPCEAEGLADAASLDLQVRSSPPVSHDIAFVVLLLWNVAPRPTTAARQHARGGAAAAAAEGSSGSTLSACRRRGVGECPAGAAQRHEHSVFGTPGTPRLGHHSQDTLTSLAPPPATFHSPSSRRLLFTSADISPLSCACPSGTYSSCRPAAGTCFCSSPC